MLKDVCRQELLRIPDFHFSRQTLVFNEAGRDLDSFRDGNDDGVQAGANVGRALLHEQLARHRSAMKSRVFDYKVTNAPCWGVGN